MNFDNIPFASMVPSDRFKIVVVAGISAWGQNDMHRRYVVVAVICHGLSV